MTRDEGGFLSRWSRLKTEVRRAEEEKPPAQPDPDAKQPGAPQPAQAREPEPQAKDGPAAAEPLPSIDTLKGLASDYTGFLKPGVDENLRRSALKKLFSDPYFETFERFAEYCDDYTKSDPIPADMLKTLAHAKGLLFDEKDEKQEQGSGAGEAGNARSEVKAVEVQPEAGIETKVEAEAKVEVPAGPPQEKERS